MQLLVVLNEELVAVYMEVWFDVDLLVEDDSYGRTGAQGFSKPKA